LLLVFEEFRTLCFELFDHCCSGGGRGGRPRRRPVLTGPTRTSIATPALREPTATHRPRSCTRTVSLRFETGDPRSRQDLEPDGRQRWSRRTFRFAPRRRAPNARTERHQLTVAGRAVSALKCARLPPERAFRAASRQQSPRDCGATYGHRWCCLLNDAREEALRFLPAHPFASRTTGQPHLPDGDAPL
jgi:hypothetical protein